MYVSHPLIKPETLSLRTYQETIFSRAVDGNTLVVLPTGLGKTVIAAMLAAHRLYSYPDSKVLFLAPTRPLAVQHHKTFQRVLSVGNTVTLTGMDAIEDRRKLWEDNQIIFATPQTIENDIIRGLDLSNVSLIIFDECHRCVGEYSYVFIADEYMKKAKNPLILGLTASPSSEKETIKEICKNLSIERVEARSEQDRDVAPYIQDTEIKWVKVDLPDEFRKIRTMIEDLLRKDLRALKEAAFLESADVTKLNKRILLDVQAAIRKDIAAGGDSFSSASAAASAMKMSHALELLETQGISALDNYFSRLAKQRTKAVARLFADESMKTLVKNVHDLKIMGIDHPKLDKLVETIKKNEREKIIVFTQYRDSVDKIVERLNAAGILAREFTGQAKRGGKRGMSQKEQIKTIEDFRQGKYNVLVATSVAEEGLDIPAVDLVVFYEPIPSEIRSIQRRGRTGRSGAGNVVVLMARNTRDEAYYWAAYHRERKMKGLIRQIKKGLDEAKNDEPNHVNGQQSLTTFTAASEDNTREKRVKIYADVRERSTEVLRILRENAEIDIRQLTVGDYILSDRVGVERKTVEDFLGSITDRRLFSQASDLARNYRVPLLIIEGKEDIYSMRQINANAVRGAIAALAVDFGISVINTRDGADTAALLLAVARREQEDEGRDAPLRGEKKPLSTGEQQRFIIESLPNVSSVLAKRLLERFGSVEGVVNASKKELMEVEGIGEGKAEDIVKIIRSRYIPEE